MFCASTHQLLQSTLCGHDAKVHVVIHLVRFSPTPKTINLPSSIQHVYCQRWVRKSEPSSDDSSTDTTSVSFVSFFALHFFFSISSFNPQISAYGRPLFLFFSALAELSFGVMPHRLHQLLPSSVFFHLSLLLHFIINLSQNRGICPGPYFSSSCFLFLWSNAWTKTDLCGPHSELACFVTFLIIQSVLTMFSSEKPSMQTSRFIPKSNSEHWRLRLSMNLFFSFANFLHQSRFLLSNAWSASTNSFVHCMQKPSLDHFTLSFMFPHLKDPNYFARSRVLPHCPVSLTHSMPHCTCWVIHRCNQCSHRNHSCPWPSAH